MSGANVRKPHIKNDCLYFSLPLADANAVEQIFTLRQIPYCMLAEKGLPKQWRAVKKRPGIFVGLFLFYAVLFIGGQFVWSIDVVGNDKVSKSEILSTLQSLGYEVGSYAPKVDYDRLHTEFLLARPDIAWVAVNLRGTRATVEVREAELPPTVYNEDTPYNLVAAEDGILREIEIHRGERMAVSGMKVEAGDLLASGVTDIKGKTYFTHAQGIVLAEVERRYRIEIPIQTTEKIYTGREKSQITLKILRFSVNFFQNTGNIPAMCDKIYTEQSLCLFGKISLPVSVMRTTFREYTEESHVISEEEARAEAYLQLRKLCAEETAEGELLSRSVTPDFDGDCYTIDCTLTLLCDIAKEQEIYLGTDK